MSNMDSVKQQLQQIVSAAFVAAGYSAEYGEIALSQRPELGDFQCNGALAAARPYKQNPRQIGQAVADQLASNPLLREVSLAGAGFVNLRLADGFVAEQVQKMAADPERLGVATAASPQKILVDYGGANVAKPLHVGHLRTAIIGESIKRLCRFLGHDVLGDIHMGDWGLQMGQIIVELASRQPDWLYFDADYTGPYPAESPITIAELDEVYPIASGKSKSDPEVKAAAQVATTELQNGRAGYRALWQHFVNVSVADLKKNYDKLDVVFDLWLGESDVQPLIPPMLEQLKQDGHAVLSDGALVMYVAEEDDKKEIPPLMLVTSQGAVGYGTTDLATILQRVQDYDPDAILYVVDGRQQGHFQQVFRAAYKSGIAHKGKVSLEHNYFGTVNGPDGKPFKTREGGTMKLEDFIGMMVAKAYERMGEIGAAADYPEAERAEIARQVGLAALKFADLVNHRTGDYVFDLDRFSSFEGRTGPYLLYAAVRARSILRKAADLGFVPGGIGSAASGEERDVQLKLLELPDLLQHAFATRAPNHLCEYAFNLTTLFNRFYRQHHILTETNAAQQASWLALCQVVVNTLELVLYLLGISVPERM
jgi:arginyl-tRNA synthetase